MKKKWSILATLVGVGIILLGYQTKKSNIQSFQQDDKSVMIINLTKQQNFHFEYYLISGIALIGMGLLLTTDLFVTKKQIESHAPEISLTDQEKNVVALIETGKTNKEIAMALSISLSTTKTHINNIYKKMQVNSRSELLKTLKI